MQSLTPGIQLACSQLFNLRRQRWNLSFILLQPVLWLYLYSQLFKSVIHIPGFAFTSYIGFVTPGIIITTALYSGSWSGMTMINDIEKGVLARLMVMPISRINMLVGKLLFQVVITSVQTLSIAVTSLTLNSGIKGVRQWCVTMLAPILLSLAFGALSYALALSTQSRETLAGAVSFVVVPLTFVAPVLMSLEIVPRWLRVVSRFNPVTWAVQASREASPALNHPAECFIHLLLLGCFTVFSLACALRSFSTFRKAM